VGIDHRGQDVAAAVAEATQGRGADVILDVLGAGALDANLRSLATGGRLVVIGLQQGRRGELDLGRLMAKRASIHGTTLRARPMAEKAAIVAQVAEQAWPSVGTSRDARIRPLVDFEVPLAQAGRAHELLAAGEVFGKVVLVP
jgi:NADPH:quinone reductase-like Zn-dependent oxidoreductase